MRTVLFSAAMDMPMSSALARISPTSSLSLSAPAPKSCSREHASVRHSCSMCMLAIQPHSISLAAPLCDNHFEGGNWALVRRVKQGTSWHPANDNLAGTYVSGTYPFDFSTDTFSIPFSTLVSQTTQMLFRSGCYHHSIQFVRRLYFEIASCR